MARTTSLGLKGDKAQAKKLSLAHTERLLYNFRRSNEFQKLLISSNRTNFFDETGMYIGEIYMQTVHGAETIIVSVASGVPKKKKELWREETEYVEHIVPCMIVTSEELWSVEIVGYIACLSGSFLGPYQWFPADINDESLVIEGFIPGGHNSYVEDLAFADRKQLSGFENDVGIADLSFHKPSGVTNSAWDIVTESEDFRDNLVFTETPGTPVKHLEASTWSGFLYAWVDANNPMTRSGTQGWDLLYDGVAIAAAQDYSQDDSGYYVADYGSISCSGLFQDPIIPDSCHDTCQDFLDDWVPPDDLLHGSPAYYDISGWTNIKETEVLYGVEESIRLNDSIADSAILLVQDISISTYRNKKLLIRPPNPIGEPTYDELYESTYDYQTILQLSIDNTSELYNVTEALGWTNYNNYNSTDTGCSLVYDKPTLDGNSTTLASVLKAPKDGTWDEMAFIYEGPVKDELQGSAKFPAIIDGDIYATIPGVIPENVPGRVKGHVFLGVIKSTKKKKIKVY